MSLILIAFVIINESAHLECMLPIHDICCMGYHVTGPLGGLNPSGTSPVRLLKTNQLPASRVGALVQTSRPRDGGLDRRHLSMQTDSAPSCSSGGYGIASHDAASDSVQRDETALQRVSTIVTYAIAQVGLSACSTMFLPKD